MTGEKKQKLIKSFRTHKKDTGSVEVQAAIFTERVAEIAEHLKTHPKDDSSRRGLLKLVSKRRKILDYLKLHEPERYKKLLKQLKLKK